jgi:signal transduction histidine kinase
VTDPTQLVSSPDRPSRWRLTAYAAEQVVWLVPLLLVFVVNLVGSVLVVVWVGIPMLLGGIWLLRKLAQRQRRISARVLGTTVASPYRPAPGGGPLVLMRGYAADPTSWRDVIWLLWAVTFGWVLSLVVVLLLVMVVTGYLWWFGAPQLMRLRSLVDRALLTPGRTEVLEERVEILTRSRADAVDHSAAELRRLERDLHDGTQARLVAVSMSLGMAEELFESDPDAARRTVSEARAATTGAIADLR